MSISIRGFSASASVPGFERTDSGSQPRGQARTRPLQSRITSPTEGKVGRLLESRHAPAFKELFERAVELGDARIYPCSMAMDVLGVTPAMLEPFLSEPKRDYDGKVFCFIEAGRDKARNPFINTLPFDGGTRYPHAATVHVSFTRACAFDRPSTLY
jgi:hypothetical protein